MKRLATRVLALMEEHDELRAYKKTLFGCCRLPSDGKLKRKLVSFSLQHPKFQSMLADLLEDFRA